MTQRTRSPRESPRLPRTLRPTQTTSQLEPAQRKRNRKRHVEDVGGRRRADVRCRLSGDGWSWDPSGRRSRAEAGLWAACGSGGKVGSDRGDYGSALGSVGSKQRTAIETRRGAFGPVATRPIEASRPTNQCPRRAVSVGFSLVPHSPRRGGGPGAAAPAAEGPRGPHRCS